ncbi:MAG: D-glycero-alpha-D-manno-heptose-1,7-bisphosphate 7-phosphatase [Candidatus Aminicenantales bacterium]
MKKRAVFLDRDGTINRDVGYPNSYNLIEIFPYSFEAVRKINQAGLLAVIITNQSGVGRGLIEESRLEDIHRQMKTAFTLQGARLDGIYYCPHYLFSKLPAYKKDCSCRKPLPGLGLRAASELNIDLSHSYMVGDKVEDILFGLNIQAQPILVLTGFGQESKIKLQRQGIQPSHIAPDLLAAVEWIIAKEKPASRLKSEKIKND